METLTQQEQSNLNNANNVLRLLEKGQFVEAMSQYLANDVQLIEANAEPKVGKDHCIALEEELLSTVTAFHGYEVKSGPAVNGNTTFYEAVMKFDTNDGKSHTFEQVVRTTWNDEGKIAEERYYHA